METLTHVNARVFRTHTKEHGLKIKSSGYVCSQGRVYYFTDRRHRVTGTYAECMTVLLDTLQKIDASSLEDHAH